MVTKILRKDGTWLQVQSGEPSGAAYAENFADNASIDPGARNESGNGGGLLFTIQDASTYMVIATSCHYGLLYYPTYVKETKNGITKTLSNSAFQLRSGEIGSSFIVYSSGGDIAKPLVSIDSRDNIATENNLRDTASFIVRRIGDSTNALKVNYSISGSAINGTDFSQLSGSVTIGAGLFEKTTTVIPIDNHIQSSAKSIIFSILPNINYEIQSGAENVTVYIVDDEKPANGNGTGLLASYFDNNNLTDIKTIKIDSAVNFNWGAGKPDTAIAEKTYSVRWEGKVVFILKHKGKISLVAGKQYNIGLDYFYNDINYELNRIFNVSQSSKIELYWKSISQFEEIIPRTQLIPSVIPGNYAALPAQ